jgi:hypothetical protein
VNSQGLFVIGDLVDCRLVIAPGPNGGVLIESEVLADEDRHILVDRAGMRLFFLDAKAGQQVKNLTRLDLQFPRQLIDANFLHK